MKPKPTIAELEAIINSPEPNTAVTINPDGSITATDGHERTIAWPGPTSDMLDDPKFTAIWDCIKSWDINVPAAYSGHMGATGNHVRAIMDAIEAAGFCIASPDELDGG